MGRIPDAIADALVTEVKSRVEWDEAPALYMLYVEGGRASLAHLPFPEEVWTIGEPAVVLASIADAGIDGAPILQSAAPAGFYGAAFRCEAWQVDAGEPGTERRRQALTDSHARRLNARPDRVEVRCVHAVDRAGVTYAAVQERGDSDVRCSIAYPKPGGGFAGSIPDALDRLVTAFLGVSMPERRRFGHDS